jgi:RND family efflux transporter MFP subunit
MRIKYQMRRATMAAIMAAAAASGAACRGEAAKPAEPAAPAVIQIGRENVVAVRTEEIRTGPSVSGSLMAERQATVRAQLSGSVVDLKVEEGLTTTKGTVIARIEARDLREAAASAETAVKSAETALKVAQSEAARTASLVKAGALAERDLELSQNAVETATAQVASARARLTSANQQLSDTTIRAPISGIVSERPANLGDVVSTGAPIATIIDPSSMRFDASVPAEELRSVTVGALVEFQVRGYPDQTFNGRIERVNPIADPVTRQVSIVVTVPNTTGRLLAGLFAEGRIISARHSALVIPLRAVDRGGAKPSVTRLRDGKAERIEIGLGLQDDQTERVEVVSGLQEGDLLLTGAAQGVTPGTPVKVKPED